MSHSGFGRFIDAFQYLAIGWWTPLREMSLRGNGIFYTSNKLMSQGEFDGEPYNYNLPTQKEYVIQDLRLPFRKQKGELDGLKTLRDGDNEVETELEVKETDNQQDESQLVDDNDVLFVDVSPQVEIVEQVEDLQKQSFDESINVVSQHLQGNTKYGSGTLTGTKNKEEFEV